jgi:hypothetical protein
MLRYLVCAAALTLGASAALAQAPKDYPPGWPRAGATLLVENDRGAAYEVVYPKDQPTPMHRHRYFFAGLDLNTATIKVTQPDGKFGLHPVIKNRMWFLPKDLTHQEMSTTDPGRHTVVIDIKDKHLPEAANSSGLPAGKFASYQTKVVDNEHVTIWDCAWSPGDLPHRWRGPQLWLSRRHHSRDAGGSEVSSCLSSPASRARRVGASRSTMRSRAAREGDPGGQNNPGARSFQPELFFSINFSFQALFHPLICFSRAIASTICSCASYQTRISTP